MTKEASLPRSTFRSRYDDACAAAHALDLVGDRWALLVMRELMTGPKRFTDLRTGLPGISANVLTQRLEELEAVGVLTRATLPPPAAVKVYALTPWGLEAEPIFRALGRWAARSPHHDPTRPFSAASFVLSLRTMFDPARADGLTARIGFRIGHESYLAIVTDGTLSVDPGAPDGADVVLTADARTLAAAIYGGVPLSELETAGALTLTGDRGVAERFPTLFPLPEKVTTARPV